MPGFDRDFLGSPTPYPELTDAAAADAVPVDGADWIDYAHFSLVMSRSRRMARVVAWNIDGEALLPEDAIGRSGIRFRPDPRVPTGLQLTDELYARNDIDRGHVARRADLLWEPDAARANSDSFFFTNITPQHRDFNQASRGGLWGRLEDDLLAEARLSRQRVCLFGGPVLTAADPLYRGVAIPTAFWKLFVYEFDGAPRAQAFLLRQSLDDLGPELFPFERWKTYRLPIAELREIAGLDFGAYLTWERPLEQLAPEAPRLPLEHAIW
ncbi:DNA/RNA non-specific endonuclease [Protaetiibacter mangrovi]|uniref:DNA/RNA non-specific endonuclease n=1 Tax=Protaetiibacter mangrovi TaxID=2970926 RepID=A0ABT1ZE31_9MICO|nr:DNA/RNA non-specific endonuclease [Protaetiibacter mangrovi]MCS0498966.1 DNA/RNA non-specific endonuclease [Protaetiibacter mangrovi]TPX03556.1 DNA/RNA non-specific endonuclease [Schumannella luteola]